MNAGTKFDKTSLFRGSLLGLFFIALTFSSVADAETIGLKPQAIPQVRAAFPGFVSYMSGTVYNLDLKSLVEKAKDTPDQASEEPELVRIASGVSSRLQCPDSPNVSNDIYDWYKCIWDVDNDSFFAPYGSDMGMSFASPIQARFDLRDPMRVVVFMHPAGGYDSYLSNAFEPRPGIVEIHEQEPEKFGFREYWGLGRSQYGVLENFSGRRIAGSILYLKERFSNKLDIENAGIILDGQGQGGQGAIVQSLIMPLREEIAIVSGSDGYTLLRNCCLALLSGLLGPGDSSYWDSVDFSVQASRDSVTQNIFYQHRWHPSQYPGVFDPEFVNLIEQHKIGGAFSWIDGNIGEPGDERYTAHRIFSDSKQDVTLDKPFPAITGSSGNYPLSAFERRDLINNPQGHYNLGISWDWENISDTAQALEIPIKYEAQTGLGAGLPDQPQQIEISVTPRRVKQFDLSAPVQWTFGAQSGFAEAGSDGVLTIDNLQLASSNDYQMLRITRASVTDSIDIEPYDGEIAIVYTRVPRTKGPQNVTLKDGSPYLLHSPDIWDKLPETAAIQGNFNAPGQLVYLRGGVEKILFDCMEQKCVPLDPQVSYDGTKVLFSVYRGSHLSHPQWGGTTLPNQRLAGSYEAQLYIADLTSGAVTPLQHKAGDSDISPVWLPDGRIMFASNRAGVYHSKLNNIAISAKPSFQLYIADIDGGNAKNVSPHEFAGTLHPYVLSSGRIAYSSWWLNQQLPYRGNNGGINWPTTLANMWVVASTNTEGGDFSLLLGAHGLSFRDSTGRNKTVKALHFLGERTSGKVCADNYYRGNNLGLGDIWCWVPEAAGIEGSLPAFAPSNLENVADWSRSNDEPSRKIDGIFVGKIGYPSGAPGDQLLLTYGKGYCTQVSGSVKSFDASVADQPGRLGCDTGIYVTTRIPSKHPTDLQAIADSPGWHEFGARMAIPYRDLYGMEKPAITTNLNAEGNSCLLASADAGSAETLSRYTYDFNKNYRRCGAQGCEIDGVPHSEMKSIRFWQVMPNRSRQVDFRNSVGNQVAHLGDVELLADKSFKVQLPCDTPFLMAGIDGEGRVIKRDQVPQSLRQGEQRVCSGCHLHSRQGRSYEDSMAANVAPIKLLTSRPVPTYNNDIKPILEQRCVSCHSDIPLLDYHNLVWDYFQSSVPDADKLQVSASTNVKRKYGLQRPYTSKYINSMFARESLLYWKAANRRTDGRTDNTYSNDIDFGANHPTKVTDEELKLIAEWIDSGAAR